MIFKKIVNAITKSNKEKKKNNENAPIMVVLYLFLALFLGIIIYLVSFTYKDGTSVINSSYNKRLNILANHVQRGSIYARDNSVIAKTVVGEDKNEQRVYPYGPLFAHAVGFAYNGGIGIESIYAYSLLTSNCSLFERISNDLSGNKNEGDCLLTTLDPMVQYAAYSSLGDRKGAVVVTDVKTGEILALVSKPDFDPNVMPDYWDYYNADTQNSPLLNRATQGLYPPGSTFKIVTALEYLRENNFNTDGYEFDCSGTFDFDGSTIRCYHGSAHGHVDFEKSFAKSCNSSFANITSKLNKRSFGKTCDELLFNSNLPIRYTYKKSSTDISSKSSNSDLLQTGIGQGKTQISPIHMNMITSAIGNNGILMSPYIIKELQNSKGNIIETYQPEEYGRLISEKEAESLTELMKKVISEGTASKLKDTTLYTAAGKTGSAEYSSDKTKSHAWFTGFAPAENPEIAVTVIVEGGGSGGEVAVPIAKTVFDEYFNN